MFRYLLSVCLLCGQTAMAQTQYSVLTIPPPLMENANAVLRVEETVFTVKSIGETTEKTRYAITILNEKAREFATVHVPYDKLTKFNYLQGALYDASGRQVAKLKKSDITDMSAVSRGSLFDDNRMKTASFPAASYPFTVEFEYETTSRNTLFYTAWTPQPDENISVEKSSFRAVVPAGIGFRYKEINLPVKVNQTTENGQQVFSWQVSQLPALETEPYGPSVASLLPRLYTAPTDFEVEGYRGNMSTWQALGDWSNKLNAGRDELPPAVKQQLQQLTAKETDPTAKIRNVYEYLQANTRYISIQLGIGGWQPFDAQTVASTGYGDCKALSNYTQAMLKAIGIESYYTLVRAGNNEPDIRTDFPSSQFNHAFLCVPLKKDTIWLECTSQTNPFGYLGSFTGDRHVLLITPQGGKLVKTPIYKAQQNLQNRKADVYVDLQGDAKADIATIYTGLQQDDVSLMMHHYGPEDQKKWLYKNIEIPSFDIGKFAFTQQKDRLPSVTETVQVSIRKCVSKSGNRIFLTPNLMNSSNAVPPQVTSRKQDVVTRFAYIDTDTIRYHLPTGYQVEYQPEPQRLQSVFGEYQSSVKVEGDLVTYVRTIHMHKGRYPSSSYGALIDFKKSIAKADKMQMVFVNKGQAPIVNKAGQ